MKTKKMTAFGQKVIAVSPVIHVDLLDFAGCDPSSFDFFYRHHLYVVFVYHGKEKNNINNNVTANRSCIYLSTRHEGLLYLKSNSHSNFIFHYKNLHFLWNTRVEEFFYSNIISLFNKLAKLVHIFPTKENRETDERRTHDVTR